MENIIYIVTSKIWLFNKPLGYFLFCYLKLSHLSYSRRGHSFDGVIPYCGIHLTYIVTPTALPLLPSCLNCPLCNLCYYCNSTIILPSISCTYQCISIFYMPWMSIKRSLQGVPWNKECDHIQYVYLVHYYYFPMAVLSHQVSHLL